MKLKYWVVIVLALIASTVVSVYFILSQSLYMGGSFSPLPKKLEQSALTGSWQSYTSPTFHYEITVPSSWQANNDGNEFSDANGNPTLYMGSYYLPKSMATMAGIKTQASNLGWEDEDPGYKNISFEKFSEDQNSVIYLSQWQDTTLPGSPYFLRADLIQKNQIVLAAQNYPTGDITILTIASINATPTSTPFDDMAVFKKIIASFKFPKNVNDPGE